MTVEPGLEQVDQRIQRTNKRLTLALTMMVVAAITIQLSGCGDDPAGPSTNCDVSDVGAFVYKQLFQLGE